MDSGNVMGMVGFIIFRVVCVGVMGLITGFMASRKGYSFGRWWFALGLLGLLVVAFFPYTNKAGTPDQVAAQKKKGDKVGLILSILTAVIIVVNALVLGMAN